MSRNVTPPVIDLREILEISDAVFSAVGLCLNSILLYLILNKTSQRLKEYRKLLLQNCIIDIVYNLAHLATRAVRFFYWVYAKFLVMKFTGT